MPSSSSNVATAARHRDDDPFRAGRLKRYGGIVTGFARTFAGALDVDRSSVLDALSGDIEPFMLINGNRGTDNPGRSTNRIRSDEYPERDGVDQIFVGLTLEQFEQLGDALGADVAVS